MEESFAPQAHHIATNGERGGDLVVGMPRGGEQDHLGAQYLEIWQRILARAILQNLAFFSRKVDMERAVSRHFDAPPPEGG